MSEKIMKDYEIMVIYTPILNEEGFKKEVSDLEAFIKSEGGEIVHSNAWGLKQLAYPIQKKTTGIYLVLEFRQDPAQIEKMKIMLNRDENVMRFMTTALDKHAVEYNAKKRNKSTAEVNTEAEAE